MVFVERVVYSFLHLSGHTKLLLYEHPVGHEQIDRVVAELVEHNAYGFLQIYYVASVCTLASLPLDCRNEHLAYFFYIRAIGYAHRHLHHLVRVVFGDVFEVLAEERAVEEGYDASVCRKHLCALIGDAVHLATYAVTLYEVAHTHTSSHKRYAVEEVLEQVLHCKTNTCGQSCRYHGDGCRRYLEHLDGYDGIESPAADGYDVVGEREVWLAVDYYLRAVILMIERLDEIVEIAEHEELRAHHHQLQYRQLHHAGDIEEVELEYLPHRVGQVEHVGCPPYRQQHRKHAQHGHQRHIYEVVEPRHIDVCAVTYGDDTEQRTLARLLGFLLGVDAVAEPSALVHTEHVVDAGDGLDAAELEHPPYQHLHRQQHVAIQCRCGGECHHEQRYPRIEYVGTRNVVVVARYDVPLPQCKHEQYRGEDERHKIVRNEHYTERYDDERHEHNGRINAESALDLIARQAHKQ